VAARGANTPAQSPALDSTPNTAEADKRLQLFTEQVQIKWRTPLLEAPKQKQPVWRQPSQPRSSRLAAQKLAHILPSKRGEILLQQKLGIPPPPPPITKASSKTSKAVTSGNLEDLQIAAFDKLFLAARMMAGRAVRCAATAGT
jgi:hypothetical protein